MISAWILLALGLLLIFIEFFMPGLILGTIGAALFLGSLYIAFTVLESVMAFIIFVMLSFIGLALTIKGAIWWIPRAPPDRSIYSKGDQTGYVASSFDKNAVGKEGVAITDLRPGGYIEVDHRELVALSKSGYIEKGSAVLVVGGEGESLEVIKK